MAFFDRHFKLYRITPPGFGENLDGDDDQDDIGVPSFNQDLNQQPTVIDEARERGRQIVDDIKERGKEQFKEKAQEQGKKVLEKIGGKGAQSAATGTTGIAGTAGTVAGTATTAGTTAATTASAAAATTATTAGAGAAAATTAGTAVAGTAAAAGTTAGIVSGPAGWIALAAAAAATFASSDTGKKVFRNLAIATFALTLFVGVLLIALLRFKTHFGPDLSGATVLQAITAPFLPAVASRDKGQVTALGLESIDATVAATESYASSKTVPNAARVTELLGQIKTLRSKAETNAYGHATDQAQTLKEYRDVLRELALAIDPTAGPKQTDLLAKIDGNQGISVSQSHGCAPRRDIDNLAVTSKLMAVLLTAAEVGQKSTPVELTCLVSGYREGSITPDVTTDPLCGSTEATDINRPKSVNAHCNGRAADFNAPFTDLEAELKNRQAELGISVLYSTGDHLHVEVTP